MATPAELVHGSAVSVDGLGILIRGKSGAGKSALALQLMALGARLVADDRVQLACRDDGLFASCPDRISGMIEARGVGILAAAPAHATPLRLVVDMDETETQRLPPQRSMTLLGVALPLLHNIAQPHFPAAILQYIRGGRVA